MYQALNCDLMKGSLAGMEMSGPGANHSTELWRSLDFAAFPDPDLTDHVTLPFVDLLTRPTVLQLLWLIVDQAATATGTR
jgi:hypothetical protein